jgi:carbohydrate-selective porin OprB
VRGGLRRGTRYLDDLDLTLSIDAERALGWPGPTLFAHGLCNTGEPFSDDLVGAAQGVSNNDGVFRRSSAISGHFVKAREVIIEATYRALVRPWLTLQPHLRYVIGPGGRAATSNALIPGVRAELGF